MAIELLPGGGFAGAPGDLVLFVTDNRRCVAVAAGHHPDDPVREQNQVPKLQLLVRSTSAFGYVGKPQLNGPRVYRCRPGGHPAGT